MNLLFSLALFKFCLKQLFSRRKGAVFGLPIWMIGTLLGAVVVIAVFLLVTSGWLERIRACVAFVKGECA